MGEGRGDEFRLLGLASPFCEGGGTPGSDCCVKGGHVSGDCG